MRRLRREGLRPPISVTAYISGILVLAAIIGSMVFAGHTATRALAPRWPASLHALGTTVLATSGVVGVAQLLGTVGLFSRVALVVGAVLASAAIVAGAQRCRVGADDAPTPTDESAEDAPTIVTRLAVAAGSLVVAQWVWTARNAFRFGIVDVDSQSYHLPHAARFVQEHQTTALHYIGAGDGAAYHPATAEMLHGIAIAALRSDVLSIGFNLAFLVVGLLAAYCVGQRFRTGATAVIGFAVVAASPLVAKAAAASAGNDFVAIAFFLAAVAFVLHADQPYRGFALIIAGLAAGLALGTKLTMVVPVLGLTATVVWIARREPRRLLGYAGAVVLTGSYWYLRNLVHVGNPVPALDIAFLPSPPMPLVRALGASVADHLADGHFWRDVVPDALRRFFGVLSFVTPAVALAGIAAAFVSFRRRATAARPVVVGLALTAAATLAAYVVTPTSAGGTHDNPFLFVYNLRYALPALVVGLLLLPAIAFLQRRQVAVAAVGVVVLVLTATSDSALPLGAVVLALVLAAAATLARTLPRRIAVTVLVVAIVAVVIAGLPLTRRYQENRFASGATPRAVLFRWGRSAPPGGRVALVGNALQYAFYGPHLATTVDYVAQPRPSHGRRNYPTCAGLRTALRDGEYDLLVVEFPADPRYANQVVQWMREEPSNEVVGQNRAGVVFKLTSPPDPATCA